MPVMKDHIENEEYESCRRSLDDFRCLEDFLFFFLSLHHRCPFLCVTQAVSEHPYAIKRLVHFVDADSNLSTSSTQNILASGLWPLYARQLSAHVCSRPFPRASVPMCLHLLQFVLRLLGLLVLLADFLEWHG